LQAHHRHSRPGLGYITRPDGGHHQCQRSQSHHEGSTPCRCRNFNARCWHDRSTGTSLWQGCGRPAGRPRDLPSAAGKGYAESQPPISDIPGTADHTKAHRRGHKAMASHVPTSNGAALNPGQQWRSLNRAAQYACHHRHRQSARTRLIFRHPAKSGSPNAGPDPRQDGPTPYTVPAGPSTHWPGRSTHRPIRSGKQCSCIAKAEGTRGKATKPCEPNGTLSNSRNPTRGHAAVTGQGRQDIARRAPGIKPNPGAGPAETSPTVTAGSSPPHGPSAGGETAATPGRAMRRLWPATWRRMRPDPATPHATPCGAPRRARRRHPDETRWAVRWNCPEPQRAAGQPRSSAIGSTSQGSLASHGGADHPPSRRAPGRC